MSSSKSAAAQHHTNQNSKRVVVCSSHMQHHSQDAEAAQLNKEQCVTTVDGICRISIIQGTIRPQETVAYLHRMFSRPNRTAVHACLLWPHLYLPVLAFPIQRIQDIANHLGDVYRDV